MKKWLIYIQEFYKNKVYLLFLGFSALFSPALFLSGGKYAILEARSCALPQRVETRWYL